MKRHIYEHDRARILTSIRALTKLCMLEKNERVTSGLDTPLLQRLLQLLLVPDEELLVVVLDFFYIFTNSNVDCGLRLASAVRFNASLHHTDQ